MRQEKKKYTIGLLVSGIMDQFTETVCKGVMHEARKANANVVVFPCKYLDRDLTERKEITYEYQYNTLFSFARTDNLDGLLISADSIGCYTSKERVSEMLEQYAGIPCVLISSKIEGYVSVNYDNYNGIKEGLEYLIHNLGCREICMIGGPEENTDAYERKRAFYKILKENGIVPKDKNYIEGTLSRHKTEVYSRALDENPEAEAFFCVNDDTALGLCKEMKKRGLVPGKDIHVFGYDNTILAAQSKPSVSSVWADSSELGAKAFDMVMRMLAGEKIASQSLATRFVRRDSVGGEKEELIIRQLSKQHIEEYFQDIFYRCKHEDLGVEIEEIHEIFCEMMGIMIELCEKKAKDSRQYMEFLWLLDRFLNLKALEYADIDNFMMYIEQLCVAVEGEEERENSGFVEEFLVSVFRKIISGMDYRSATMKETEVDNNYAMKMFIRDTMQFENGNDQSYTVLLEQLHWQDIGNAFLYTMEKPMVHLYKEKFKVPKKLYLKAVLKNGEVQAVPSVHQKTKIQNIFQQIMEVEEGYYMTLLPLFSKEMLYGVILCELSQKIFGNGEFFVNQISSAVRMIQLLSINEKIQEQLEESLVTMRENNIALDTLSKSDGLTGILNRRGFYDAAEDFLAKCRKRKKQTLVAYIDMNNLKIINDRYGHEEGDFSLKLIGGILLQIVKGKGIAGRIGGDEFACIIEYDRADEGTGMRENLYECFRSYNTKSEKVYNITVSAGICIVEKEGTLSLKEALALADVKLYDEKQNRVKSVAKEG